MSPDIGFASQTPSLPGGGSAAGLGETFAPDLSTGSGTLAVPLDLPNGPNDSSPKLALRYDSGSPNGPFGVGWSIGLPRVLRSTMIGRPRYDVTDTLVLEGSGPLVRQPDGTLRPEVETGDWRIVEDGDGFLVTDRAGTRFRLGEAPESRIAGLGGQTWAWLLHAVEDNLGEATRYAWRAAGSQRYLDTISWGPYELRFGYEARPDVLRWGRGGFLLTTEERCSTIELHLPADPSSLVRRWVLGYAPSSTNGASQLVSVVQSGFAADGSSLDVPALQLTYTAPAAPALFQVEAEDDRAAPPPLDGSGRVQLVDWTGTGTADVIEFGAGGTARVWPNHAGRLGRPRSAGEVPALAGPSARSGLLDVDGDGRADLIRVDLPLAGFAARTSARTAIPGTTTFDRPVTWRVAPSVAPDAANVALADFDGDGRTGLLWSTRDTLLLAHRAEDGGWLDRPDVVPSSPDGPPTDLTDPRVHCADMTGDGTPDLVRVDGAGVTYWPYLGQGVFGDPVRMSDPPRLPFDCDPATVLVVDLDGDGCADVLHLAGGRLRWWANRSGTGFLPERVVDHLPTGGMASLRVADLLGSGRPALCWTAVLGSGRGRWFALDPLGGTTGCSLLSGVDNGCGRTTTITWSTSARESERDRAQDRPWRTTLPVVLPVVTEVSVSDATSGPVSLTRYAYHDGRYDAVLREVCGFGEVTTFDVGDATIPTLVTTSTFHVGLTLPDDGGPGQEPDTVDERRRARAVRGRLLRQERAGADGYVFDRYEADWVVVDGPTPTTVTPRLAATVRSVLEGQDVPVSRIVTEQLAWDADGNVTQGRERSYEGAAADPSRELVTSTTYAVDASGRFRQRIARVVQHDGDGALLSDLRTHFDGTPEGAVGSAGLVTERLALALLDAQVGALYGAEVPDLAGLGYRRLAGSDGWWVSLGRYTRTVTGGILQGQVTGAAGGTTSLTFDASGCYPVRVVDAVGCEVRAEFDLRLNQPTAVIEPSGARREVAFDALARLTRVVEPGDTAAEPTRRLDYDASSTPVVVTASQATGPGSPRRTTRQFADGAGRIVQQRVSDESGEIVTAATAFGLRGVTARAYLPFRAAGLGYAPPAPDAPHTSLTYDALGRLLRTVRPDGAVSAVRFLPGVVEERDAEQSRNDAGATHAGGFTRRTVDAAGRVVRVEQGIGGQTATSTDRYDIKGTLVEHVDAAGRPTTFAHDLLGRTVRIARPEATQVLVVDAAGNVVEARTGSAHVLRSYDLAGRPVEVRHGTPGSAPVATLGYDPVSGRLAQVQDEGGTTTFSYDDRGRIAEKVMTPPGSTPLTLRVQHRSDGLVDQIAYPGGRVVGYRYSAAGLLSAIDGVIDEIDYDLAGRVTRTAYANGVTETDEHDPLTGWRTSSEVAGPGGPLRAVTFAHDLVGNLTSLTSPGPELAWSYGYDDAYRLVRATSAAGVLDYAYDLANNLTASPAGVYGYGAGGAPSSALTSVGADSFGYDDRGQLTSAPWGSHTVDAEGRLRSIVLTDGGSESLTYGYGGALVRRVTTTAAGTVHDVASPDRLVRVEDGELTLQISDGQRVVARERGGVTTWLHVDHVGSLVLLTDATGAEVLRLTYDPYGQVLTRTGPGAAPEGFGTGQDLGHGLVLLGARWYAPRLGRFLSPDPLVGDPDDPAAWNAYAYCRCNPTSYVDPSGRSFWKIFAAVVATVAIIAVAVVVTVCTFGAAGPGAVALSVGGLSVTWGAVFAATVVGVVAGGVIGGIAAARAGGDAGDIFLGAVVGGAVGGWAAFGAAFAGVAVGGALGLTSGTVVGGAVVGGVSGAVNGAAMGFAAGFAGGKNKGLGDVMEKVLVGAITGLAVGAALGALSGMVAPKESIGDASRKLIQPPDPGAGASGPAVQAPGTAAGSAPTEINTLEGAGGALAKAAGGKLAGTYAPYVAAWLAPAAGNGLVQAILVDGSSAAAAATFDDLQEYLRTHNVDLGPFDFVKGTF